MILLLHPGVVVAGACGRGGDLFECCGRCPLEVVNGPLGVLAARPADRMTGETCPRAWSGPCGASIFMCCWVFGRINALGVADTRFRWLSGHPIHGRRTKPFDAGRSLDLRRRHSGIPWPKLLAIPEAVLRHRSGRWLGCDCGYAPPDASNGQCGLGGWLRCRCDMPFEWSSLLESAAVYRVLRGDAMPPPGGMGRWR